MPFLSIKAAAAQREQASDKPTAGRREDAASLLAPGVSMSGRGKDMAAKRCQGAPWRDGLAAKRSRRTEGWRARGEIFILVGKL